MSNGLQIVIAVVDLGFLYDTAHLNGANFFYQNKIKKRD